MDNALNIKAGIKEYKPIKAATESSESLKIRWLLLLVQSLILLIIIMIYLYFTNDKLSFIVKVHISCVKLCLIRIYIGDERYDKYK